MKVPALEAFLAGGAEGWWRPLGPSVMQALVEAHPDSSGGEAGGSLDYLGDTEAGTASRTGVHVGDRQSRRSTKCESGSQKGL